MKHQFTFAVAIVCAITITFSGIVYLFYLKKSIAQYDAARHQQILLKDKLTYDIVMAKKTHLLNKQLQSWKIQSPKIYHAAKANFTAVQLWQSLTRYATGSGFTLDRIEPLQKYQHKKHQKRPFARNIQVTLRGQFNNIFTFISALNQFALPIAILKLNINKDHQFRFTIRGYSD